jgi:hypothetical protein
MLSPRFISLLFLAESFNHWRKSLWIIMNCGRTYRRTKNDTRMLNMILWNIWVWEVKVTTKILLKKTNFTQTRKHELSNLKTRNVCAYWSY